MKVKYNKPQISIIKVIGLMDSIMVVSSDCGDPGLPPAYWAEGECEGGFELSKTNNGSGNIWNDFDDKQPY